MPYCFECGTKASELPPRARGWTLDVIERIVAWQASPARAGMDPVPHAR